MPWNLETTNPTESDTNSTNIEKIKESIKKFWGDLHSIANEYKELRNDIEKKIWEYQKKTWKTLENWNDYFLVDNEKDSFSGFKKRFIDTTKEYVTKFHEWILSLENKLNEYNNSSLKQEISETLGWTPQENTSENITEEIKILIKQLKEQAFDKYLKYEYNDETRKIEWIYFKLPPSDFEHEPTENLENIYFGNRDFKYVTELFFLWSILNRVKNKHKDLIISLSNEYCKHVYEILSLDEDDKRIYDKVFEYLGELITSNKKKVLDEDVKWEIIKRFNKDSVFKDVIDILLHNYRDLFDIDDKSMENIQTGKN